MKCRLQSFILSFTSAFALTLCLFSNASAQTPYTGGAIATDVCCGGGNAINAYGDVTGGYYFATARRWSHAFLYTPSSGVIDLGTLGGDYSVGQAINASDEITGYSAMVGDAAVHAFLYTPSGGIKDLGTLGGDNSWGLGINANGEVVGYSTLPGSTTTHAFLYSGGTMKDLGVLGRGSSMALAINDSGQMIVWSSGGYFLYSGGKTTELKIPNGSPQAINDFGQITGHFLSAGISYAFLYSGGTMTDLEAGTNSYGWSINNFSQVVGPADTGPFLYTPGMGTVQLYSLLPPVCEGGTCFPWGAPWGPGVDHDSANAINDAGQITGIGVPPKNGFSLPFLLSPVTSPFSAFQVKLQFIGKSETHFRLRGSFSLGADSNGFDPLTQPVLLQLGSLPIPIQKGLFSQDSKGDYVFQGVVGSAAVDFRITPVTRTRFKFRVEGLTAAPFRLTNPARFILMIGNNETMGTLPWR